MSEDLAPLALDLTKDYPRSPRAIFAGYVIVGRILDKCRAVLNNTAGEYQYNYGMDRVFFEFTGIDAEEFKRVVASGATDDEVAQWIKSKAKVHSPAEIASWNFTLKCRRISELPPDRQAWIQDYLTANVKPELQERVIFNFDVLDAEEGRMG
jgi:hypothetical protein